MSECTHHMGCDLSVIHPSNVTGTFILQVDGVQRKYRKFVDIPRWIEEIIVFKPDLIPPPHSHEQHVFNENVGNLFYELQKRLKPVDYRSKYAGGN